MSRLGPLTFLNEQGFVKQNMVNLDYLALFDECSRQVFFNEYASLGMEKSFTTPQSSLLFDIVTPICARDQFTLNYFYLEISIIPILLC